MCQNYSFKAKQTQISQNDGFFLIFFFIKFILEFKFKF